MNRERWEFSRSLGVFLGCIAGGVVATFGKPGVVLALVLVLLAFGFIVYGLDALAKHRDRRQWRQLPEDYRPQEYTRPSRPARLSGGWWRR